MRAQSRRLAFVLDAIAVVLEALDGAPEGDEKERLVGEALRCEQCAKGWRDTAPTGEQREELMKRVLGLHVATARLRRADERGTATAARPTESDRSSVARMQDLLRAGALEDALATANSVLQIMPLHRGARDVVRRCTEQLEQRYEQHLAPLHRMLTLAVAHTELAHFDLDRPELSIVTLVGHGASVEAVLSASGEPRLGALRVLCNLVDRGVLGFE
jgi:hypothetical protein